MANDNCIHYWLIDSNNVGVCKYCGAERDFGKLLGHEPKLLGLKSKKGGARGKRGRKKKEEFL